MASSLPATPAHTMSPTPLTPSNAHQISSMKKVKRKTSKPIFNWIQRKLAPTRKSGTVPPLPNTRERSGSGSYQWQPHSTEGQEMGTMTSRGRKASALKVIAPQDFSDAIILNDSRPTSRNTSRTSSSPGPGSTWSPSNPIEADDDASIRPLPPTSPPSPAPSRSSSSYLSDPRTFRSGAASTKPTTLLSIDSGHGYYGGGGGGGGGVAHIAQAPLSQAAPVTVTSRSPTISTPRTSNVSGHQFQAPLHTAHHPRNNPNPASPPLDNASVLTLASSAFASPGRVEWNDGASTSASYHHYRDVSSSHIDIDETVEEDGEGDVEASVRALRPRSSRRGSWESGESRWSARVPGSLTGTSATGRPGSMGGESLLGRSTSASRPRSGLAMETTYNSEEESGSKNKLKGLGVIVPKLEPGDIRGLAEDEGRTPPANQTLIIIPPVAPEPSPTSPTAPQESKTAVTILPSVPEALSTSSQLDLIDDTSLPKDSLDDTTSTSPDADSVQS